MNATSRSLQIFIGDFICSSLIFMFFKYTVPSIIVQEFLYFCFWVLCKSYVLNNQERVQPRELIQQTARSDKLEEKMLLLSHVFLALGKRPPSDPHTISVCLLIASLFYQAPILSISQRVKATLFDCTNIYFSISNLITLSLQQMIQNFRSQVTSLSDLNNLLSLTLNIINMKTRTLNSFIGKLN